MKDRGEPSKPSTMGLTDQDVEKGGDRKRRREDDRENELASQQGKTRFWILFGLQIVILYQTSV